MTANVFAVPVFFIVFRETIETSIIVAVLLAFIKQTMGRPEDDKQIYKRLVKQVWIGTGVGLIACLIIGAGLIGAFYGLGKDIWASSEDLWEGIFALIASVIITLMGAAILRVSKLQAKWQTKLTAVLTSTEQKRTLVNYSQKYSMLLLPLITVLREGLEAIVFVGGVSFASPATAFPLPVVIGLIAGCFVGYIIYRGGDSVKLQWFLIASTCLLYLVAAGLFSKSIWSFQQYEFNKLVGGDVSETGAGPGSYDIRTSVWHVNCCSPNLNAGGGWGIFNSILGWQNSATYGSVISYNIYWITVSCGFFLMRFKEKHERYPFMKAKSSSASNTDVESAEQTSLGEGEKQVAVVSTREAEEGIVEVK